MRLMTSLIVAGLICTVAACSSMPKVTRTGELKDIKIAQHVEPTERTAAVGDEVRWINRRTGSVRIVFLDPIESAVSCNNGFGGLSNMFKSNRASIDENETVSLCLNRPGSYRYTVRMDSSRPGGEINESGVLKIGPTGS
ncbi:MAG: hypothetical protein R3B37_12640 [Nitrospira sp.]|nr:hypothetical protein [Nitrospira sp.]